MLIFDLPRRLEVKSEIAVYDQLDALPNFQNVQAPFDRLATAEVGLFYSLRRKSLGAVDDESGIAWETVLESTLVHDAFIPQIRGGVEFGFPLLPHSSLWLRSAAGVSGGSRGDPFASYFFGGFGNNYVDRRSVERYRQYGSFPGFAIDAIGGHEFARQMAEVRLPPVVFEKFGTPAFHLAWLRLEVFASTLWTDLGHSGLHDHDASTGAQVDLRFSLLHWYELTLSGGYAVGFRGWQHAGDEWMLSLKIL